MLDFPKLRADVAHFTQPRPSARPGPAQVRAALREAWARHADALPPLPELHTASDVERFVPQLPYLFALLRESGLDKSLRDAQ
jgi:hypothetical protein